VFSFGTGKTDDDDELQNDLTLKMIALLQEHGWDFTFSRDPVLILIEIEEYLDNSED